MACRRDERANSTTVHSNISAGYDPVATAAWSIAKATDLIKQTMYRSEQDRAGAEGAEDRCCRRSLRRKESRRETVVFVSETEFNSCIPLRAALIGVRHGAAHKPDYLGVAQSRGKGAKRQDFDLRADHNGCCGFRIVPPP